MTKTLTEQWREGTLPDGHYYCKLYYNGFKPRIQECVKSRYDSKSCIPMSCGCEGEEVLAPVPSYDEYLYLKTNNDHWHKEAIRISKQAIGVVLESDELVTKCHQLEKRLEIATKALKEMVGYPPTNFHDCETYMWAAQQALKEMEGLK